MLTSDCKNLFSLDTESTYLDYGSFGAPPKEVLRGRLQWLERIEKAPASFFAYECRPAWKERVKLASKRFAVRADDFALVDNVTDGINAVLRSLVFQPNDEILITSLTYGAIANAADYIASKQNARVAKAQLQFLNPDPQQCIEAIKSAITPHTKLAILDHITSGTGLVLPIAEMTRICHERGVAVLVDGAHAPGHIALDINAIKADWYAANLHKWYFVPRSCGFLWANPDRQKGLVPNVLSWDIYNPFPYSFEWTGTRDPSAWLSIPEAFGFMDRFEESKVRHHNHDLIMKGAALLSEAWGSLAKTPQDMIGNMCLIPLPKELPFAATDEGRLQLQRTLWDVDKIVISAPLVSEGRIWIRISAQIYNTIEDYDKLARAIHRIGRA